ncbi:hypothetical protein CTI12_AA509560 [Artemisia annua]|uniref:DUF7054 domain-containing protein n=1 Tax=Artemisia annua TaxID=35608 RepID=A0A2U1LBP6_ARTAN|nr:hypothetical protein CTI12_AA509560 [Artemisia annua]
MSRHYQTWYFKKKDHVGKSERPRILIKINVVGSAGPIRFVVNEDELVASVIDIAIKMYAREGRLPVLRTKLNEFFLYTPIVGSEALSPLEMIGSFGVRNFLLCKKPSQLTEVTEITRKSSSSWKSWFNKSLSLKITTQ